MHIDHVVGHRRPGVDQDLTGLGPPVAHQQFMEEEVHELHMPRVPHGLVVDVLDLPQIGVAHRPEAARGGEGFQLHPVDIERLMPFHRRDPFAFARFDHLAIVEILVDHAVGRPIESISVAIARLLLVD